MRVSDTAQVLFIHLPKNGGTTIDAVFDQEVSDSRRVEGIGRHSTLKRIAKHEPELVDYWSFGFVRNPWDRIVSWYAMFSGFFANLDEGRPSTVAKFERKPDVWGPVQPFVKDFETFVHEGLPAIPRFHRNQIDWLRTADGRQVDFIGRVENFRADLDVVRDRLGLAPAVQVARHNKSKRSRYQDYYTAATQEAVAATFAADIEAFGYRFEEI